MKKTACLLLALLLLSSLCLSPAHADFSVTIDEAGLSLSLPDNFIYITRELAGDDPVWDLFDLDRGSLIQNLVEQNAFLDAFPDDLSFEVGLVISDSESIEKFFDFNLYDDEELIRLYGSDLSELLGETEFQISKVSIHQSPEAKFVVYNIDTVQDGSPIQAYAYSTIYNGRAFSLSLRSFEAESPETYDTVLRQIADSIHFLEKLSPTVTTYAEEDAAKSPLRAAFDPGSILTDAAVGAVAGLSWWLISRLNRRKRGKRIGDPED